MLYLRLKRFIKIFAIVIAILVAFFVAILGITEFFNSGASPWWKIGMGLALAGLFVGVIDAITYKPKE